MLVPLAPWPCKDSAWDSPTTNCPWGWGSSSHLDSASRRNYCVGSRERSGSDRAGV